MCALSSADELREHVVGDEGSLLTATVGKLTTFEVAARHVLPSCCTHLRHRSDPRPTTAPRPADAFPPLAGDEGLRMTGRHGREAGDVLAGARPGERTRIAGTSTTWAEVRWSARNEAVTSVGDLMLRRTRLGLLLPGGVSTSSARFSRSAARSWWDAARVDLERTR